MIDYKLLHDSTVFYESNKFLRVETPWTVTKAVDEITKPADKQSFQLIHNNKCLVASGEQSFLYQYLKGFLPKGQFQTITPCFRFEDYDAMHSKTFMKNELIKTDVVNKSELNKVVEIAVEFFSQYFSNQLDVVTTDDGYDIEIEGNELGSYGIRQCEFLSWIYGTGCAEGRTSKLIKIYGLPSQNN